MSDDEPITEIGVLPVPVPETNRQWKLTPALNLLEKSRQIAIVSADTEDDANARLGPIYAATKRAVSRGFDAPRRASNGRARASC